MKVAIFGGSFNPPHMGHILCAAFAKAVSEVDEVWVMPVGKHPYGKKLTDWWVRFDWCTKAFAPFDFVSVKAHDNRDGGSGKTWDLIDYLESQEHGYEFHLICGTDVYDDIKNWYRGKELWERMEGRFIPIPRGDENDPSSLPPLSSSDVRAQVIWRRKSVDLSIKKIHDTELRKSLPPQIFKDVADHVFP